MKINMSQNIVLQCVLRGSAPGEVACTPHGDGQLADVFEKFFILMCIIFDYVCGCGYLCMSLPVEARGIRSPGTRVAGCYELSYLGAKN